MGRPRVILPSTERVELSDGDWLELKREISYGESLELSNAVRHGDGMIDVKDHYLTRAALWIVDWSFTDEQGKVIPWDDGKDDERSDAEILARRKMLVASLDGLTGGEIQRAITLLEAKAREGKAPKIEGTVMETTESKATTPPKIVGGRRSS